MVKKLLLIAVFLLAFTSMTNTYASTIGETSSDSSTCKSCENNEKGELLSGQLKDHYIQNAIEDKEVSDLLENYKAQEYQLVLEDSQVGKSHEGIIGTTLVLVKKDTEKDQYAYILYNDNTGQVKNFDQDQIEKLKEMNESQIQPQVCLTCILYCAALVEIPAAFAACIVFCAGAFC
ncbi:hypothetical protein KHA94_06985 [Bacillus sp. FJAT-49705]|uniref:Uncharacterized protein n=1 Tax=Cytobacillus citreus TaxID=2833586 RepID=A0ABS5NSQ4_9BACI|nr:hypothetical protein [Cytobacillus citreus]MBS4189949.1 hypothetical protein [Cytobacillus citreus]